VSEPHSRYHKGRRYKDYYAMKNKLQEVSQQIKATMIENLGIEITVLKKDCVKGKMPVDKRTVQRFGLLHGGASAAFAETLGSIGGTSNVNFPDEMVVGIEINANHIKGIRDGWVYGEAKPAHIGNKTQVWEIRITDKEGELVCLSRLTLAKLKRR